MHTLLTEGILSHVPVFSGISDPFHEGVGGGADMDISGTIHCKEKSNVYLYRITCR